MILYDIRFDMIYDRIRYDTIHVMISYDMIYDMVCYMIYDMIDICYNMTKYMIYMIRYDMIRYYILVNCKWVDTRWQYYTTYLHINNTQNNTIYRTIKIQKLKSKQKCTKHTTIYTMT